MRALLLAALAVTACTGPRPGTPLSGWERADPPDPLRDAPDTVPDGLDWAPVERVVFAEDLRATWLRAEAGCTEGWRDPVVFVPKAYVRLAAYVNGRRVGPERSYRQASGTPWYAIPVDCGDAPIVFRLESRYTQIGFPEVPRVGERAELIADLVPRDAPRLVLAVLFLILGVGAGGLAFGAKDRGPLAGLAIYGLGLTGWTLFHTRTKQLWLPEMELWFATWWVSVPLVGVGVAFFVDAFFGPLRRLRALWMGLAIVTLASALSLAVEGDAFRAVSAPIFIAGRGLSLVGSLVVTVTLVGLARRGDREASILLVGLVAAFATVFHDIALSMSWIRGDDTWTQYGYGIFGLTLVVLVRHRMNELQRQLAEHADELDRYVRERDRLMNDLHDGLGGIVTNVGLLAERSAKSEGDGGVLRSIAKLASDGIIELRTLLFGFDGPPRSWRQVGAELRRGGSTALEAHGIGHAFVLDVADRAPRPELSLVVQLLRIHREALTNALKHAEAETVTVRLAVTEELLELTVGDDGRGFTPGTGSDSDDPVRGKGLGSMRARARELGGTLTVESDSGTTVRLEVPL